MKKILFPTDFSAASRQALRYASELAADVGAQVDILAVYNLPLANLNHLPEATIQKMVADKKHQIAHKLADCLQGINHSVIGSTFIEYGLFVEQEIVELALRGAYDLIVMGSKGEKNEFEVLLGSITTQTMLQAPCPVLAVPEGARFTPIHYLVWARDEPGEAPNTAAPLLAISTDLQATLYEVLLADQEKKLLATAANAGGVAVLGHPSSPRNRPLQESLDEFIHRQEVQWLALNINRRRLWEKLFHTRENVRRDYQTRIPLLTFRG